MTEAERAGETEDVRDSARTVLTKDLVAGYLAGDPEAARKLFERSRAELLARAQRSLRWRALRGRVTPEDVVQEVFNRAFSVGLFKRFQDRGRGSLNAMLREVLGFTLRDVARHFGAQKRGAFFEPWSLDDQGEGEACAERLAAKGTTPTARARAEDLMERCRQNLTEREWEVFRSIAMDGWTPTELAQALGKPPNAVRGLLFRAREKLVAFLRENGVVDQNGD